MVVGFSSNAEPERLSPLVICRNTSILLTITTDASRQLAASKMREMNQYFGWKWLFSEMLMKSLFQTRRDERIDLSVQAFDLMNNEEIMEVIFQYQFRHTLKSYFWYALSRLKNCFGRDNNGYAS